jgi:hypothetical protein
MTPFRSKKGSSTSREFFSAVRAAEPLLRRPETGEFEL